jgi:hypothetical protein
VYVVPEAGKRVFAFEKSGFVYEACCETASDSHGYREDNEDDQGRGV